MKKLVAIILALVMALALYVPTFAAGGSTTSASSGNSTVDVDGEFVPATDPGTVISVDIEWDALVFTYSAASAGVWNSTTHTYDDAHPAFWSDNKVGITVTNHSNAYVDADFTFTASKTGLKGVFYMQNADNSFTALTESYLALDTAIGTTAQDAPVDKIFFGMDSTSEGITESEAQSSIGTITISIKKSSFKRTVKTEAELNAAMAELNAAIAAFKTTGGTIELANNITLTDTLEIPAGTGTPTSPLIFEFAMNRINGNISIVGTETSRSYVTFQNGYIDYTEGQGTSHALGDTPDQAAIYVKYADLRTDNITINSQQLGIRSSTGAKVAIHNNGMSTRFLAENVNDSSETYFVSIYDTSYDPTAGYGVTLSGYNVSIDSYIVSEGITLKANGMYTVRNLSVEHCTDSSDMFVDCNIGLNTMHGRDTKVVLDPSTVLIAE